MKKSKIILLCFLFAAILSSCNDKKLTEVVEVPLPAAEEKMTIGHPEDVKAEEGAFKMLPLPYEYDALAPSIDAGTMEIHYSKHYLTYTNNLNKVLVGTGFEKLPIEEILAKLDMSNADLRNNAGGYYNHNVFWESLSPKGGTPADTLAIAINRDFGSYDNFQTSFKDAASKQFGSGWVWLVTDKAGKLQITNTQNQDNPLMPQAVIKGTPILALDLWEHAYYLGYQYKRKNYIDAFFKIINWKKVGEKYEDAMRRKY